MSEFLIMRVPIEGEWWAFEMAELVDAVDELYADVALILTAHELIEKFSQYPNDTLLLRSRAERLVSIVQGSGDLSSNVLRHDKFEIEEEFGIARVVPLQVLTVKYGSDGFFDFLGFGKIAEAAAKFYDTTVKIFTGKPERDAVALENIITKLKLADLTGMSDEQKAKYAEELLSKHDRTFRRLAAPKRLTKPMELLPPPANIDQRKPPDLQ